MQDTPTKRTAGFDLSMFSLRLRFCLGCGGALKVGRMGRPCTVTWLGFSPILRALFLAKSVGTKQRSTSG